MASLGPFSSLTLLRIVANRPTVHTLQESEFWCQPSRENQDVVPYRYGCATGLHFDNDRPRVGFVALHATLNGRRFLQPAS